MSLFGNLPEKISRLFENDTDEILVFIVLFVFLILTEQSEGDTVGGFPVIVVAIFLVLFLLTGNTRELAE